MSQIRGYLLSVVGCSFVISVLLTVVKLPPVKKILQLCCGCLLILTVVAPIFTADFTGIKDYFAGSGLASDFDAKEAERKNMELVGQMIKEQTAEKIAQRAQTLGCEAWAEVELTVPEGGVYPEPASAVIHSACGAQEKKALQAYIEQELGIPADRQSWVLT